MSSITDERGTWEWMMANDPFRYGWRDVQRTLPDGSTEWVQEPLTLEDVLHPEEEDRHVQRPGHIDDCAYLYTVFTARLADIPHAVVTCDLRTVWPGIPALGPDISVIFNVREKKNWPTFYVKEEGTGPAMVIEITSPHTRVNDVVKKFAFYHQAGVPLYVLADAGEDYYPGKPLEIRGYRHTPEGYEPLSLNERGWLWLPPVRLWLGCENGKVVCYDEKGVRQGNYTEVLRQREEAEKRIRQEEGARAAIEEQYLIEARAHAASEQRAEAEAQARVAAEQRAEAEARARAAAETEKQQLLERLWALEEEVQRKRNGTPPA